MVNEIEAVVTFQARGFNTSESRPHFLKPHSYGDDLIQWIIDELKAKGVKILGRPKHRNSGWSIIYVVDKTPYQFTVAYPKAITGKDGPWYGTIERHVGLLKMLFGTAKTPSATLAVEPIDKILSRSSRISGLKWTAQFNLPPPINQPSTFIPESLKTHVSDSADIRICRHCNQEQLADSIFCDQCGEPLNKSSALPSSSDNSVDQKAPQTQEPSSGFTLHTRSGMGHSPSFYIIAIFLGMICAMGIVVISGENKSYLVPMTLTVGAYCLAWVVPLLITQNPNRKRSFQNTVLPLILGVLIIGLLIHIFPLGVAVLFVVPILIGWFLYISPWFFRHSQERGRYSDFEFKGYRGFGLPVRIDLYPHFMVLSTALGAENVPYKNITEVKRTPVDGATLVFHWLSGFHTSTIGTVKVLTQDDKIDIHYNFENEGLFGRLSQFINIDRADIP